MDNDISPARTTPDGAMGAEHLARADFHVARANDGIAAQEAWIARNAGAASQLLAQARSLLAAMRQTRQQLLDHRATIVLAMAAIEAGAA